MLLVDRVSKRVGSKQVLRHASLSHTGGGTLWLRGQNGTGKSTLLKCVAGVWRPDCGDILVCGGSTVRDGRARSQVGYVPDTFAPFPNMTVSAALALIATLRGCHPPAKALLDEFGVSRFSHQGVLQLSAGQTRRTALVAGLIGDPWLLVLDEPTTGLDGEGVALLRNLLRDRAAKGLANLLVTHDVSLADDVGAKAFDIKDGHLVPETAAPA